MKNNKLFEEDESNSQEIKPKSDNNSPNIKSFASGINQRLQMKNKAN